MGSVYSASLIGIIMTVRNILIRGLIAGLFAGFFTFLVAHQVGEPHVNAAIAVEEAHAASEAADRAEVAGHHHEEEGTVVTRHNQRTWGLATGTMSVGVALGGLAALVSAAALGRIGRLRPTQSTALIALLGFIAIAFVPFIKYPSTPPAVGDPDTIGARTGEYFTYLIISVVTAVVAVLLTRRLLTTLSVYQAVLIGIAVYLVTVVVAGELMPTVNEVGDFPADTLWYFRRASLITLATMWGSIGIILTGLIGKLHERDVLTHARRELAASL